MKILIIEASYDVRVMLCDFFQRKSHEAFIAADSKEALRISTETTHIDWIIANWRTSPMSGLELINEIKKTHPSARSILIASYVDPEHAIKASKAGVSAFLSKPFALNRLLEIIASNP